MRLFIGAALLLVLIACEPVTQPTTTTDPVLPPPDPVASTTTTTNSPTTTRNDPSPQSYRGFLPDGTDFHARIRGLERETLNSVGGTFSYMTQDGPVPVGGVRYSQNPSQDIREGLVDGILGLWLDPWYVEVIFSEAVLEAMGEDAEEIATRSIRLDIQGQEPWPILELSPPFTWEGGDPLAWWKTFVITTGCDDIARLCTENRVLQVQSVDDIIEGRRGLTIRQIDGSSISTETSRRPYDAAYLDPGPLDRRYGADVIWTGDEMIIWGGKQTLEGLTTLVEGAAFDPKTNEWHRIASFPLQGPVASRAIWAENEMVVVSTEGTFGYDPEANTWKSIGDGVVPSESHGRVTHVDGRLFVWARLDVIDVLDLETGNWSSLQAPGTPSHADPYFGVLRHIGDRGRCSSPSRGEMFWGQSVRTGWSIVELSTRTRARLLCNREPDGGDSGRVDPLGRGRPPFRDLCSRSRRMARDCCNSDGGQRGTVWTRADGRDWVHGARVGPRCHLRWRHGCLAPYRAAGPGDGVRNRLDRRRVPRMGALRLLAVEAVSRRHRRLSVSSKSPLGMFPSMSRISSEFRGALIGGAVAALGLFGGVVLVGGVGDFQALRLIEATLPTVRFLASTAIAAGVTVLALMLTLIGITTTSDLTFSEIHFSRIRNITSLALAVIVAGVAVLVAMAIPIAEVDELRQFYSTMYYALAAAVSLVGGLVVAMSLMIGGTVRGLVDAAHPEGQSHLLVPAVEDEDSQV